MLTTSHLYILLCLVANYRDLKVFRSIARVWISCYYRWDDKTIRYKKNTEIDEHVERYQSQASSTTRLYT
jgi:hypothetical protein